MAAANRRLWLLIGERLASEDADAGLTWKGGGAKKPNRLQKTVYVCICVHGYP